MHRSEVEEWLISIGLHNLYPYFIEDGFTTLEHVRSMRQADIDAIVDRNGFMIILNEEIDKLNNITPSRSSDHYTSYSHNNDAYHPTKHTTTSEYDLEPIEKVMKRYEISSVPSVGFASQHLARRSKSARSTKAQARGVSALPGSSYRESSASRYVPTASDEFEAYMLANRRSYSVAPPVANTHTHKNDVVNEHYALLEQQLRSSDRFSRAKSEMHYSDVLSDGLDRGRFRDHYTNEYVWVEKNHITDVGVKYDGLSRRVDHKPSHWRCEDEIERGKEFKRMNDEYADRIADNRQSIDNSREWLTTDGGVIDRVHRMSAQTQKTRYDLDSIRRNMDNIKAMRTRLLKS